MLFRSLLGCLWCGSSGGKLNPGTLELPLSLAISFVAFMVVGGGGFALNFAVWLFGGLLFLERP